MGNEDKTLNRRDELLSPTGRMQTVKATAEIFMEAGGSYEEALEFDSICQDKIGEIIRQGKTTYTSYSLEEDEILQLMCQIIGIRAIAAFLDKTHESN